LLTSPAQSTHSFSTALLYFTTSASAICLAPAFDGLRTGSASRAKAASASGYALVASLLPDSRAVKRLLTIYE
jgi:hypothetical protein